MRRISVLLLILSSCSSSHYPLSDHFDGEKFYNPWLPERLEKSIWQVAQWRLTSDPAEWPETLTVEPEDFQPWKATDRSDSKVRVTLINHSTVLVQFPGFNILTDPIYSDRTSPVSWAGPKRVRPPAIRFEDLPKIDIVMVSHNHYDHLDLPTLADLDKKFSPLFLVPLGNRELLESEDIQNIKELDWWQEHRINEHQKITLTPSQHWSARGIFDRRDALWGSYVIHSHEVKVYFAGDTGYGPHFKMVRDKFGPMFLSLLPIGAYEPRWFMKQSHVNPAEAVQAHQDLASQSSFGIHFGTFQLTDEGIDEPVAALSRALRDSQVEDSNFTAPEFGKSYVYDKLGHH